VKYPTDAESDYKNYYRMNEQLFNELLKKITPYLTRKDAVMRDSLTVEERLALTLRFLANGRAFEDMKFSVIISASAISQTLFKMCFIQTIFIVVNMKAKPTTSVCGI
jgi:hypothetical protein